MTHPVAIPRYPGSLADLAGELGDLRYDALAEFLHALSAKLASDAEADAGRGRHRLAADLRAAADGVGSAVSSIEAAWRICEPRMGE